MGKRYLADYGQQLIDNEYAIVPIKPGTKFPGYSNWQNTKASSARLAAWLEGNFKHGGVGVLTKHTPAVDIDVMDADVVDALVEWCDDNIGDAPQRVGNAPKTMMVYRTDEPFTKVTSGKYRSPDGKEHKVEILGDGQQFVAYAIHPDTKRPYEWTGLQDDLVGVPREDLRTITVEDANRLISYFERNIPDDWELVERASSGGTVDDGFDPEERAIAYATPPVGLDAEEVREKLENLDPDMLMADWLRVGMATYHEFDGSREGFDIWNDWSSMGDKYEADEMRKRWKTFDAKLQRKPVTMATVIRMVGEARKQPVIDSKFKLITAGEVLAKLGPIRWSIDGFLEQNTVGTLFGDPGSFTSFIALDMALSMAASKQWHDRDVLGGPVVYIAGEGHNGLARRMEAWGRHNQVDVTRLPFYVSEQAAHFYDAKAAKLVAKAVDAVREKVGTPALIVIDTLAKNFGPGDESSNSDMGQFVNHVDTLLRARFGATVLIVLHTGHTNKERARGAMSLRAGVDFEYLVSRSGDGMVARLSCHKMKDAQEAPETFFEGREIPVGDFDDEDEMTSLAFTKTGAPVEEMASASNLKGRQLDVFNVIQTEGPVERETLFEICVNEGIAADRAACRKALQRLREKELIVENDDRVSVVELFDDEI